MITEILTKATEFLNNAIDFIIFWDNWGQTSQFFFIGLILFIILAYALIKIYYNKENRERRVKW